MSGLFNSLTGGLLERKSSKLPKPEMTSNLDELFKGDDNNAYVNELKKAIFYIERLTPKEIPTPFRGNCLELTNKKKNFVFGSNEGRIAIIDKETKEIVQEIMQDGGSVYSIAIYSDDLFLLAAGKDGIIRKFTFESLKLDRIFIGHEKDVNKVLLSIDESHIFSASDDCTVRIWSDLKLENSILYKHDKAVLSLDKSECGNFLISGGADKKVIIFDLDEMKVEKTIYDMTSAIWTVRFSRSGKTYACGDANAVIKLFRFEDHEVIRTFSGHSKRISHFEYNNTETVLVSSSNDGTLRIWSLTEDKNDIVLTGHTDWVKDFKLSDDNKHIYSIAENFKILCWYMPNFDTSCRKKTHNSRIHSVCLLRKNEKIHVDLLFSADHRKLNIWNLANRSVAKSIEIHSDISAICSYNLDGKLLIAYSNKEVHSLSIEEGSSKKLFKHPSMVKIIKVSLDGNFLVIGDTTFRVTIMNGKTLKEISINRKHSNTVTAIEFEYHHRKPKKMYSGGSDFKIFIYNLEKGTSKKFGSHSSGVTFLILSRDQQHLISSDESGAFKIWNTEKKECIKLVEYHSEKITAVYFTENNKYFWVSSNDASLSLWNTTNFSNVTQIFTRFPVSDFCLDSSENELMIAENESIYFFPNIVNMTSFNIYGPGEEYYSLMKYIMDICEGNHQTHIPQMDKWLIVPFEFNALHLYAYFNMPLHLKQAMNSNSPFFYSKSNISPIHICVERNFRDCINEIIRNMRFRIPEDPYLISFLEDQIVKLNLIGFRGLDELYEAMLYRVFNKSLLKFVSEDIELPIIHLSDSVGPINSYFFKDKEPASCGKAVSFYQSALKTDMTIGSQSSIEFLESLVECPNPSVFRTKLVRELVLYKWAFVKRLLFPQAFLYFLHSIFLSYYLIVNLGENSLVMVLLLFSSNVVLTLYEIFQMFLTQASYFTDTWNYVDIARFSTCHAYCAMYWFEFHDEINKQVLVVLTFLTMLRGISYFRLFDKTRYMINLLKEVFTDMTSFIILLTYSTYSFALIYFIMVNNILAAAGEEPQPFTEYIAVSYLLNLGDFNTDNYGAFEWLIFFFASVINPLIMLNLLISLMGDTYGRVQEEQEIADMRELTEMVIEGEYLIFCKRNSGKKKYIQICTEEEVTSAVSTPMDKVDKLKRRIKAIQANLDAKHEATKNEIKESIGGVSSKLDEMSTLIEQINFTQDKSE